MSEDIETKESNVEEVKPQKKTNTKRIVNICLNVLFYAIIILLVLFSIANLQVKDSTSDIPNLFGKGYLAVTSDSMNGTHEDSFDTGDLINVRVISKKEAKATKQIAALEVGDIVTFYTEKGDSPTMGLNLPGGFVTHRIVYISADRTYFIVQGDKLADYTTDGGTTHPYAYSFDHDGATLSSYYQIVFPSDIKAVYTSQRANLGKFVVFLQTKTGFGVCVVLPVLLILVYYIITLVMMLQANKTQKLQAEMAEQNEAEKEKMKEEMRKQLLEEMKNGSAPVEEAKTDEEKKD